MVTAAATGVAVAAAGIHDRRLPALPMVSALVVCIFGGLNIALAAAQVSPVREHWQAETREKS
ncbi:MAG: hypothetical protein WD270_11060 [Acetobacterales bacterium]